MISGDLMIQCYFSTNGEHEWMCKNICISFIKSPVVWTLSVPSEGSHNCPSSVKHSLGLTSDLKGLNKEQKNK